MTNTYFLKGFKGKNRWWRYIIMIIAVFIATQIGSIPFAVVAAAKAMSAGVQMNTSNLTNFPLLGINSNLGLVLLTLAFVAGLITLMVLIKPLHQRSFTDTITGRSKFDWKRFFFAAGIWGGFMIVSTVIGFIMNPENYTIQFDLNQFVVLIFIAIIFLGLQSTFEEVFFRGYLQQGLAVLTKNTWIPLILTSLAFGLLHISNPEVKEFGIAITLPQYILLGFVFAICVVMDEGLEMAIGVHVVNNVLSALLVTHNSSVLQTSAILKADTIDPAYSLYELIIFSALFLWIVSYTYKWGSFKKLFTKISPEI